MSSSTTRTTPATGAAVTRAERITQIEQSLSSVVTNLLTELACVNVSTDPDVSNSAIMAQLQALHTLVEGISTRLAAVEKRICKATNDVREPIEIEPEVSFFHHYQTADEYNTYARSHNATLGSGKDALMPLRTRRNTYIVGFPSTVSHLAALDFTIEKILLKGFALSEGPDALWTFVGAKLGLRQMCQSYSTGEALAEMCMEIKLKRAQQIEAAGPPTAVTRKAAHAHNRIARAANATSCETLLPIHDEHNIPVYGWPRSMVMLAQPYRRWDVLYVLEEYGQSVEKKGCIDRLVQFVGAKKEEIAAWMDSGHGELGSYWKM